MFYPWVLISIVLLCNPFIAYSDESCESSANGCNNILSTEDKLVFAQVISHHGMRNPNPYNYPNDPYKEEKHWENGFLQLTNEGIRQMYRVGEYLRRRYQYFLSEEYSPKDIYVYSLDNDRTIVSALTQMAGLYPPKGNNVWRKDATWQPVPVHTVPLANDRIFFFGVNCPKYTQLREDYEKTNDVVNVYKDNAKYFDEWSAMSGKRISTIFNVAELFVTIETAKAQNKSLADWQTKAIEKPSPMEDLTKMHCRMNTATPEMARLFSGFFIKEMVNRFQRKMNGSLTPDRKVWVYSSYDLIITNFMNTLGVYKNEIPPPASSVHVELYDRGNKDYYVSIFYRKTDEEQPEAVVIEGCGAQCPFNQFVEKLHKVIPGDFDEECHIEF